MRSGVHRLIDTSSVTESPLQTAYYHHSGWYSIPTVGMGSTSLILALTSYYEKDRHQIRSTAPSTQSSNSVDDVYSSSFLSLRLKPDSPVVAAGKYMGCSRVLVISHLHLFYI